jgi:cell wall-associated NlpC family hydrolase
MKWLPFLLTASTALSPMSVQAVPVNTVLATTPQQTQQLQFNSRFLPFSTSNEAKTLLEKQALEAKTLLEKQAEHAKLLEDNRQKIQNMLDLVKKTVGRTWYVYSGDTPAGWDCSGLTSWAYSQIGVTLPHRATLQAYEGTPTTDPKPGDLVVFTYKGYKDAYHVGIYLSPDVMIDAPRPGYLTTIESISKMAHDTSVVTYRNILDN